MIQPKIQSLLANRLLPWQQSVLESMFSDCERLVLKKMFGGGFGGGQVFMVRPVRQNGAELLAVVKLGPASVIQREYQAFTDFIERRAPKVARIDGEPVYTVDGRYGGLRYPVAGDGLFQIDSLKTFAQQANVEDVLYVLEKQLFPSLSVLWENNQIFPELPLRQCFDAILPVNLVLEWATNLLHPVDLYPDAIPERPYPVGTGVRLSRFVVTEIDHEHAELTLDCPSHQTTGLVGGYRVRIAAVPDVAVYQVGWPILQPIAGIVRQTRATLLQAEVNRLLDEAANETTNIIWLPGLGEVPNPLAALDSLLHQTADLRIGPIHGDLNLENILVEYDQHSHSIHLIDFANARQDCVLHDLLRLETGFWLYLVPQVLAEGGGALPDLRELLQVVRDQTPNVKPTTGLEKPALVLKSVRRMVSRLLTTHHAWETYEQALTLYLLGALKFSNLDTLPTAPLPKQVALVTAVFLQQHTSFIPLMAETAAGGGDGRFPPSSLTSSSLPDLLKEARVVLQECEQFESQRQLRAFFSHPQLKAWRNRLPEEHRLSARVDGVVAMLHNKQSQPAGKNALVLLLQIVAQDPNTDEEFQSKLMTLADQIERVLVSNK